MQERKQWHPLGICHRLITFIMNSVIARSLVKHVTITSPHPTLQASSSNGVVSMEDQQPLVPNRPNGVESLYHQQAQHRPDSTYDNSGFEIKVHQTTGSDSKMRKSTVNQKLSSGTSLQELNPIFTSISPAKDLRKSLSIADAAGLEKEKEKDNKKKGTMLMSDEKFTLAMVGAEDEGSNLPLRRARPLFYVAPNINEKSDEFIRSRKEAMRRSQSLELPRTY